MEQYRKLVQHILDNGINRDDRTKTGTKGVFGYQMRFDLRKEFPLVTAKQTNFKPIVEELLWFLRGETNIATLKAKIWDEWSYKNFCASYKKQFGTVALVPYTLQEFSSRIHNPNSENDQFVKEYGDLGPIYGKQWRSWVGVTEETDYSFRHGTKDQIADVIKEIKKNPFSRRLVVSAWNPMDIDKMALPPCHCLFQFYCEPMTLHERKEWARKNLALDLDVKLSELELHLDSAGVPRNYLSCQLYQRSGDVGLGVPFNIASYALLTHIIAQITGCAVKDFIHTLGDAHIYANHLVEMEEMLALPQLLSPQLEIVRDITDLCKLKYEDFALHNYHSHPFIKLPVAV